LICHFLTHHNGQRYVFVVDFGARHCQPEIRFIKCTALQISTFRPLDFSLC
jgi:hypothetical protein